MRRLLGPKRAGLLFGLLLGGSLLAHLLLGGGFLLVEGWLSRGFSFETAYVVELVPQRPLPPPPLPMAPAKEALTPPSPKPDQQALPPKEAEEALAKAEAAQPDEPPAKTEGLPDLAQGAMEEPVEEGAERTDEAELGDDLNLAPGQVDVPEAGAKPPSNMSVEAPWLVKMYRGEAAQRLRTSSRFPAFFPCGLTTRVAVTLTRGGRQVGSRVVGKSGDPKFDLAVLLTLHRTEFPPFPKEFKNDLLEEQMVFHSGGDCPQAPPRTMRSFMPKPDAQPGPEAEARPKKLAPLKDAPLPTIITGEEEPDEAVKPEGAKPEAAQPKAAKPKGEPPKKPRPKPRLKALPKGGPPPAALPPKPKTAAKPPLAQKPAEGAIPAKTGNPAPVTPAGVSPAPSL